MSLTLRPVDFERDPEAIARIMGEFDSEPLDAEGVIRRWRDKDLAESPMRLVAEVGGEVVGYMNCRRWTFLTEGMGLVDLGVTRAHRRQGVGTALMSAGLDHAHSVGWTTIASRGREEDGRGPEAFLASFGFQERFRLFESTVDLRLVDEGLKATFVKCVAAGFEFVSLEGMDLTETLKRELWMLQAELDKDEPGTADFGTMDFEAFCNEYFDDPDFLPSGFLLGVKDGEWAGFHSMTPNHPESDTDGVVGFTGVREKFRGRGLATALKWFGVERARTYGWTSLVTFNDTRNAPMLAVNRKFGYVGRPGWVHMKKELT